MRETPKEALQLDTGSLETNSRRYRFTVEYDGTDYFGWQLQPGQRTVQGVLESALESLFGIPTRIHGSGRTDTGVHALGQIAHFDTTSDYSADKILNATNAFLPDDIRALEIKPVSDDFHARFSARWRWYRYCIFTRQRAIGRDYGWQPKFDFDSAILQKTVESLLGEHDFAAFTKIDSEKDSTICSILMARWVSTGNEWHFHIVANRFLRHMVRQLVGTMLNTARGRFTLDQFFKMLSSGKKEQNIYTAPAGGLCLMQVGYGSFPQLEKDEEKIPNFPFEL